MVAIVCLVAETSILSSYSLPKAGEGNFCKRAMHVAQHPGSSIGDESMCSHSNVYEGGDRSLSGENVAV